MAINVLSAVNLGGQGHKTLRAGTANLGVYATNGIGVTPDQLGLSKIDFLFCESAGGMVFRYSASAGKILAYRVGLEGAVLAEVTNSTDITAAEFAFFAIGAP
jgi:hypothetical protein